MRERISPAAFDLIVRFESGNRRFYEKKLKRPTWPGGSSGVTIGFGYDLGYETTLDSDWDQFLTGDQISRLARTIGNRGRVAQQSLSAVRDIEIAWDWAAEVFNEKNLPREIRKTLSTFPGSDYKLPADAFGALVSLIFNRGTNLDPFEPRRREMRMIRVEIEKAPDDPTKAQQASLCETVAKLFLSMRRLWRDDPESDGDLADRRTAEAELIRKSIT